MKPSYCCMGGKWPWDYRLLPAACLDCWYGLNNNEKFTSIRARETPVEKWRRCTP